MQRFIYTILGLLLLVGSPCFSQDDLKSRIEVEIGVQLEHEFVYIESFRDINDTCFSFYREPVTEIDKAKIVKRIVLCLRNAKTCMEKSFYFAGRIEDERVRAEAMSALDESMETLKGSNPYAIGTEICLATFSKIDHKGSKQFLLAWDWEEEAHFYTTRAVDLIDIYCRGFW